MTGLEAGLGMGQAFLRKGVVAELRSEGGLPGSPGGRRGGLGKEGTLTDGNDGRVDGGCCRRGQYMQR